jgi:hypothetical protein
MELRRLGVLGAWQGADLRSSFDKPHVANSMHESTTSALLQSNAEVFPYIVAVLSAPTVVSIAGKVSQTRRGGQRAAALVGARGFRAAR